MNIILAQEGTPWKYPGRYIFNNNLIELRDCWEFGMGTPLVGELFIYQIPVSNHKFGGPIILTDKYIYIGLFEPRRKRNTFWEQFRESHGYYISRVSYSGNVEILSKKFKLVYLLKIEDDMIYFTTSNGGKIQSIKLPPE